MRAEIFFSVVVQAIVLVQVDNVPLPRLALHQLSRGIQRSFTGVFSFARSGPSCYFIDDNI